MQNDYTTAAETPRSCSWAKGYQSMSDMSEKERRRLGISRSSGVQSSASPWQDETSVEVFMYLNAYCFVLCCENQLNHNRYIDCFT